MARTGSALTHLDVYAKVAANAFGQHATYRMSTVGSAVASIVMGMLRASVFVAVVGRGRNGFDASDAATFAFLAHALDAPVSMFAPLALSDRVRTGDVAVDLYRPIDLQLYWLAHEAGRAAFHFLTQLAPPLIVGGLVFDLRLPRDATVWMAFGVAVVCAIFLSAAMRFVFSLSAFWLLDGHGLQGVANVFAALLSGWLVPLALFPPLVASIGRNLPWASMLQLPAEVFLGDTSNGAAGAFARQLAWGAAFVGGGRLLLRQATRRLVVQGG